MTFIVFQILNLFVLAVTAWFIIRYWKETQEMKCQMIEQNRLAKKQIKSSNMPILDAIIEEVKASQVMDKFQMQFAYDLFLVNKGSGTAFNISIHRHPSNVRGQKELVHAAHSAQIDHFQRDIKIIGKDEKVFVHREQSDSYRAYTLNIMFYDIFRDRYEWEFEGDRDGLSLKTYVIFRSEDKPV